MTLRTKNSRYQYKLKVYATLLTVLETSVDSLCPENCEVFEFCSIYRQDKKGRTLLIACILYGICTCTESDVFLFRVDVTTSL